MTNQELKIRVTLDTEAAKKQLGDLVGAAGAAGAGGAGSGGGGGKGGKAGASGGEMGSRMADALAAGPKMMFDSVRGGLLDPATGGLSSILDEGLGGYGAGLQNALFGSAGPEAKAASLTREQIMAAFGMQAGREGAIPAQAFAMRDQLYRINRDQETGRAMFERDDRFRQTLDEAAEKIGRAAAESTAKSIEDAVRNLPSTR